MNINTYRLIQVIMVILLAVIIAVSIAYNNWIVPVIVIVVSLAVLIILRNRVREIVADERTYAVAQKASSLTLQIVAIGMALAGIILLAISRDSSSTMGQTGLTLCFATCGLLIINYLTYYYYSKKLGGRE